MRKRPPPGWRVSAAGSECDVPRNKPKTKGHVREFEMRLRLPKFLHHVAHHPIIGFSALVVVLSFSAAFIKTDTEVARRQQELVLDITEYANLFEHDLVRTIEEIDRTLKYLRRSHVRENYQSDWPMLLREDFTVNARTVQMAVIDAKGRMITSTAQLYPKTVVDLSDRAHYRYHIDRKDDVLFISEPVIGRASGKASIQFTRKLVTAEGDFNGVIVASLDPAAMVASVRKLHDLSEGNVAIVGRDMIVRSAAGSEVAAVGSRYMYGSALQSFSTRQDDVEIREELKGEQRRITATKALANYPLLIVTSMPAPTGGNRLAIGLPYYVAAALLSFVTVAIGLGAYRRQRQHLAQIAELAHTDVLTGLHNRLKLRQELQDVERTPLRDMVIHLIDLDRFKDVNDTHGHPVGDKLLAAAAARIREGVRDTDTIFRLGGDEFAVIQRQANDAVAAAAVARRLCISLNKPYEIDGLHIISGASIGTAVWTDQFTDGLAILKAADAALYKAKASGRGVFEIYGLEIDDEIARRRRLELDLRVAVENGDLEVHYQPKYAIDSTPRLAGYEALVRWRHPERGLVPPLDFISLAEETRLIVPIGNWVLERACRDMAELPEHLTIAVNVSAVQFSGAGIVDIVRSVLEVSGLAPGRLELEITETMLVRQKDKVGSQLEALRKLGVRVALDDFGTGYSSFTYLQDYPVDIIKIDRSFVSRIGGEKDSSPIIRAIVTLASELDLETVAEGVETLEQLEALAAVNCRCVQGYYFSPPRPAHLAFEVLDAASTRASATA